MHVYVCILLNSKPSDFLVNTLKFNIWQSHCLSRKSFVFQVAALQTEVAFTQNMMRR